MVDFKETNYKIILTSLPLDLTIEKKENCCLIYCLNYVFLKNLTIHVCESEN